jgi:hypothetical protein
MGWASLSGRRRTLPRNGLMAGLVAKIARRRFPQRTPCPKDSTATTSPKWARRQSNSATELGRCASDLDGQPVLIALGQAVLLTEVAEPLRAASLAPGYTSFTSASR